MQEGWQKRKKNLTYREKRTEREMRREKKRSDFCYEKGETVGQCSAYWTQQRKSRRGKREEKKRVPDIPRKRWGGERARRL